MNVIRLAWSNYQNEDSLKEECKHIESLGHDYLRIEPNGPRPSKLSAYDVVIVNSQFTVDESFIKQWESGLVIAASNGYDNIDLESCREENVPVARTPHTRKRSVVAHTFTFISSLLRDFHRTGRSIELGNWNRSQSFTNVKDPAQINIGILGFGIIGRAVVKEARRRNFRNVLVTDPVKEESYSGDLNINFVPFDDLLSRSDVLTLHADLNETTDGLMQDQQFEQLGEGSYFVNTARGSMVKLDDLMKRVTSGFLAGAALDVFPEEPPNTSNIRKKDGVLLTPHSAGFGMDLLEKMRHEIGEVIESYDSSEETRHLVTSRSDRELKLLEPQQDGGP